MKLIVGLGNPGKQYENTRHNVGFMVLDSFASRHNLRFDREKFSGIYTEFLFHQEKVLLLKPQSFINLSGEVVRKFVDYFKINIEDVLIIHDDLDLSVGDYKLKPSGSSGGHNGLKNIELHLGTKNYKRYKIGISNDKNMDTKDYVLGKFSLSEYEILDPIIQQSHKIIEDYVQLPYDLVMNRYNGKR